MRRTESGEVSRATVPEQPAGSLSNRAERLLERRWEPRYTTHDPATVKVLPAGKAQIPGVVLDISRFGIGIELPTALEKTAEVRITMPFDVVVLGQVRYSVPGQTGFHTGISTREVIYDREESETHLHDDVLALFASGRGLTAPEVIKLKDHLIRCEECRIRLADAPLSMRSV
jgi:hypothetical protein